MTFVLTASQKHQWTSIPSRDPQVKGPEVLMNLGWWKNGKKFTGAGESMGEGYARSLGSGQGSVQASSRGPGFSLGWCVKWQEDSVAV